MTTAEDVKDVEMPAWKKRALEGNADASEAPFGMSWGQEATVSATAASEKTETGSHSHSSHDHEHGHS